MCKKMFLLVGVVLLSSCTAMLEGMTVQKVYDGPELPDTKVATVKGATWPMVTSVLVDGKDTSKYLSLPLVVKLLPGKHVIVFLCQDCGGIKSTCSGYRDSIVLELEFEAGHVYTIEPDNWQHPRKVNIFDATVQKTVKEVVLDENRLI